MPPRPRPCNKVEAALPHRHGAREERDERVEEAGIDTRHATGDTRVSKCRNVVARVAGRMSRVMPSFRREGGRAMSEWKKVRLGDVCDVINGRAYSLPELLDDGKYRILRVGNFFTSDRWYYSDMELPSEKYCEKGDLLFAWSASFGPLIWDGEKVIYHYHIWKLLPDEKLIDKKWLYFWLLHSCSTLTSSVHGSVMAHMTKSEMEDSMIPLPPLPAQRKIAAVLGALDDKIENNRKICANLEAQAQAIFRSWFVDFEPFGGKMPNGWKMGKLGDVAIYRQGKIAANELTPETYYSTENMLPDKQGLMPATSLPQIGEVPACEKGDVLISNIRPYFKKICFSWSHGGHSPDVLCLAAKNDNMRYWLYRQLWDDAFFAYVMSSTKGTKMPRGDKEQILAYGMAIPNENDVARFNAVIEPMCESIVHKGFESRALAALRDALLPKLMSGEIDVEKVEVA